MTLVTQHVKHIIYFSIYFWYSEQFRIKREIYPSRRRTRTHGLSLLTLLLEFFSWFLLYTQVDNGSRL